MTPLRILSMILLIMIFSNCENSGGCENTIDYTYYGESNIRTKTVRDCNDNLKTFQHYKIDCKNCYCKVYYSPDGSPDSLEGKAWIHVFWNNGINDFKMGDTLDITVEVAAPPNLESEFKIFDNDNNSSFTKLDSLDARWSDDVDYPTYISGTFYNYKTVINDSTEYFEMSNKYFFDGKPWMTVTRNHPFFVLNK